MSDEHSPRASGLMASLCAGMFVFGIVVAILGAILPSLFSTIALDKAESGNLFLVMNFAMLIISLAFGPVVDRFGFKAFLLTSAVFVAASLVLLSAAGSYPVVLAAVAVLGFAGGGINGGANALSEESLFSLQEIVHENLHGTNDEKLYGEQVIVSEEEEVLGFSDKLLIGATDLTIERLVDLIHERKGLAIAAHVDREGFGIIGQLGFIPEGLPLDALELADPARRDCIPPGIRLPVITS